MSVTATRVDEVFDVELSPGAFEFFDGVNRKEAGMIFVCPCGCGDRCSIDFRPAPSPSWDWDGNREAPTLSPSVHRIIGGITHWHGWLRAGKWESC